MKSEVKTITPDLALQYLDDNIAENRSIRQATVSKYARDMRHGRWRLTHQGIAFDENGKLIDGQHRLWAIVEANIPIDMLVTTGIPVGDVVVIDGGLSRNIKDQIKFVSDNAIHRSQNIQSFIRQFCILKLGYPKRYKFSVDEMLSYMNNYPNIMRYVYRLTKRNQRMRNSAYFTSIIAAIAVGYDVEAVSDFVECVGSGMLSGNKYNNEAAIKFRYWYDSNNRAKTGGLTYAEELIVRCEKAIYMFCNNLEKVRGYKSFDVDLDKFKKCEKVLEAYYNDHDID